MIDTKERNKLLKMARKLRQNAEINRSHASDLRFSARNKRKQAEDIGLQLFPWSERAFHNDKDRATHSRLEEEALNLDLEADAEIANAEEMEAAAEEAMMRAARGG